MKVESTVFVNSISEVNMEGFNFRIDFGTVVMTLTPVEAALLCVNILARKEVRKTVFESLNEKR